MIWSFRKSPKPSEIQIYCGKKNAIISATQNKEFTAPCGEPLIIDIPFTFEELGSGIISVMKQSAQYTKADIRPNLITDLTGFRSLHRLVKEYRYINMSWPVDASFYFVLYSGRRDGGYCPTSFFKKLPLTAGAEEIGRCVSELLLNAN